MPVPFKPGGLAALIADSHSGAQGRPAVRPPGAEPRPSPARLLPRRRAPRTRRSPWRHATKALPRATWLADLKERLVRPRLHRLPHRIRDDPLLAERRGKPAASAMERAIAEAVNKLRPIVVSSRQEDLPWDNAELLVAEDDAGLVEAVRTTREHLARTWESPAASARPEDSPGSGSSMSTSSPFTRWRSVTGSGSSPKALG
jgi:hypothetical protein